MLTLGGSGCEQGSSNSTQAPDSSHTLVLPTETPVPAAFDMTLQPGTFPNGDPCMFGEFQLDNQISALIVIADLDGTLYSAMALSNGIENRYYAHVISGFDDPELGVFQVPGDEVDEEFWDEISRNGTCSENLGIEIEGGVRS